MNTHMNPEAYADWNLLNPEGFEYYDSYTSMTAWEMKESGGDWFVREYALINEMEDRATVYEAFFRWDESEWENHPHVRKKLEAMLAAAEPVFGKILAGE